MLQCPLSYSLPSPMGLDLTLKRVGRQNYK
jgi:hypothetical protein